MSPVVLSKADTREIFSSSRIIPFDMLLFIAFDNSAAKTPAANLIKFWEIYSKPAAFLVSVLLRTPPIKCLSLLFSHDYLE